MHNEAKTLRQKNTSLVHYLFNQKILGAKGFHSHFICKLVPQKIVQYKNIQNDSDEEGSMLFYLSLFEKIIHQKK